MAHARPRRTTRSPTNAAWTTGLTPMQRHLAGRWLAEAGQADFAAVASAYASARRKPGPDLLKERWPLLLEVQRRVSSGAVVCAKAMRDVADETDAQSIPGMPTSDSLQRWFRAHYRPHSEALASQLRREADAKAKAGFAGFVRALQAIQDALHSPAAIERIDTLRAAVERGATYVLAIRQALVAALEARLAGAERTRLIAAS